MYKRNILPILRYSLALVLIGLVPIGVNVSANAATSSKQSATTQPKSPTEGAKITQSYNADPAVQIGMIVGQNDKDPTTVVPLPPDSVEKLLGIVIPANSASIVLTPQKVTKQQVLVTTYGRHNVLVSNQNGRIKVGDYLAISAISGVAMRAGQDQSQVVGKASAGFAGTSNVLGSVKLKDTRGKESTASIGRIPVEINIEHNPLYQNSADYVPGFLAKGAQTVSGKAVSTARIYISMGILLLISLITGNVLYSGIKGGMIAVGRNPLSKKSILRSLIETVIAGIIIFVTGVFAVYLLLKL